MTYNLSGAYTKMSYSKEIKKTDESDLFSQCKKNMREASDYFKENYDRYNYFMRYVCYSTLDSAQRANLATLQRPQLEFNTLEQYISKECSEFINQEPSCLVHISDSVSPEDYTPDMVKTCELIESLSREKLGRLKTDGICYDTFFEQMTGGFSVWQINTDWIKGTFKKDILIEKKHSPTLCFFDPSAKLSHKGDGNFSGNIIYYEKDEFISLFGKKAFDKSNKSGSFDNFKWTYKGQKKDYIAVCEYFYKKSKRERLYLLPNGMEMYKTDYDKMLKEWVASFQMAIPPEPIDDRMEDRETICRYIFSRDAPIEEEVLDFSHLPMIFFDGNSVMLNDSGSYRQVTRPAVYHAKGGQELKNIAGRQVAFEIENTIAHKLKIARESIDIDYTGAITNFQQASTVVYNAFMDGDSDKPVPIPTEIVRPQIPQIIPQTFSEADKFIQASLGSYDAQMNLNDKDLSGKAIMQSNLKQSGAFSPYVRGFINGMNRFCEIFVDMIPKTYTTPRSMPIIGKDGRRSYVVVNSQKMAEGQEQTYYMNYDPKQFNIKIEAGVNCDTQKQMALEQIISLTKASPQFAQFMNEYGLETILDNIDIRGIEKIKVQATAFMQEQLQAKQMAMQNKPKDPVEANERIEIGKLQQKSQEAQMDAQISAAELTLKNRELDIETAKVIGNMKNEQQKTMMQVDKVNAEKARTAVTAAVEVGSHMLDIERHKKELKEMERAVPK